jgi:hypothetical protein
MEHLRTLGLASEVRQDIHNVGSSFAVIATGTAWVAASEALREHLPAGILYRPVRGLKFAFMNRTFWRRGSATPALLAFVAALARVRDERLATVVDLPGPRGEGTTTQHDVHGASPSL